MKTTENHTIKLMNKCNRTLHSANSRFFILPIKSKCISKEHITDEFLYERMKQNTPSFSVKYNDVGIQ